VSSGSLPGLTFWAGGPCVRPLHEEIEDNSCLSKRSNDSVAASFKFLKVNEKDLFSFARIDLRGLEGADEIERLYDPVFVDELSQGSLAGIERYSVVALWPSPVHRSL
jgi:hypothetical protein